MKGNLQRSSKKALMTWDDEDTIVGISKIWKVYCRGIQLRVRQSKWGPLTSHIMQVLDLVIDCTQAAQMINDWVIRITVLSVRTVGSGV